MKIQKIKLKNFQCYSGDDNEINFTEGLNLVLGANGYGKSKLYDAFNWVFFGGIIDQKGELNYSKNKLISEKAIQETSFGRIECKVSIELKTAKDEFLIERKYRVTKTEDGIVEENDSDIQVFRKGQLQFLPYKLDDEDGFNGFVRDNIISQDVLSHLWFQGERGISKAVDTSNAQTLHRVISKVSYIEMWKKYVDIAEDAYRRVNKLFQDQARKSDKKKKKRLQIEDRINELRSAIKQKFDELHTRMDDLVIVKQKITDIAISSEVQTKIRNLQEKEARFKTELDNVSRKLDLIIDQSDRNLFNKYWLIHGTEIVSNKFDALYKDYIYEKQKELKKAEEDLPELPKGNPTATHIRKMLDDEHCYVCDRKAPKGSEHYKKIERLLPKYYPTGKLDEAEFFHDKTFEKLSKAQIGIQLNADSFAKDFEDSTTEYHRLDQRRVDIEEKIEQLKDEVTLVLGTHGLSDIESGVNQGNQFKSLNTQSSQLSNFIGRLENQITDHNKEKEALEKEYQKLFAGEVDDKLNKQLRYYHSLVIATKDAKESQYESLVQLLESETNNHYENINKETGAFYGQIKFHKNSAEGYTAKIHNSNGDDITDSMNTSQVLSMQLSILFAILSTNKKQGLNKRYPLIADAPNSSFDPKKRKYLLKEISSTFDQSIVMMFEFLKNDQSRDSRYKVDKEGLEELKTELEADGLAVNVIFLDIPDNVNPKNRQELSVKIKQI